MAFSLGFVSPTAQQAAMHRESTRRQEKRRMSADIHSSLSINSADTVRKTHATPATSPTSPGYNVTNVIGSVAYAAVKAATDRPLKGPDVGPDGNIIVSNPFYNDDD